VKARLDLAVSDLGPTQLKNIAEPSISQRDSPRSSPLDKRLCCIGVDRPMAASATGLFHHLNSMLFVFWS
jgi:hypothetical protein